MRPGNVGRAREEIERTADRGRKRKSIEPEERSKGKGKDSHAGQINQTEHDLAHLQ